MQAPTASPRRSDYGRPLIQPAREIGKHVATLHRWRIDGVLDSYGVRRRLAMSRIGGRWHVRDEDLDEFFRVLASADGDSGRATTSTVARTRSAEQDARELDRIDIC